jgi:hypothetical protein
MNDAPSLPWPFKPGDVHPYLNVEIAPSEYVTVVLAGDYKNLIAEYLQLRDEYQRLTLAAQQQIEAARHVVDVWQHFGNPT